MAQLAATDQLYRSREACLGGVCAGIAKRYDLDPIVARILAVLFAIVTVGLGVAVYVALWVLLPIEPERVAPYDITPERAESITFGEVDCADLAARALSCEPETGKLSLVARLAIAVGLMLLFLAVSFNVSPMVSGTQWWEFWPLGLLIVGLCLIVIPVRNRFEAAWHAGGVVVTSLAAMMLPISLGVVSWSTLPYAFSQLWALVALAAVLFAVGLWRHVDALVLVAAFLVAAFCLLTLVSYALPGEIEMLMLHMPDGRSLRIAMAPLR